MSLSLHAALPVIEIKSLDGTPFDLSALDGKTILFVNVASRCGFTKQYAGLQKLHDEFKDKGLVVIGVPSNDFGGQEPGTAGEIAAFCSANFGVTFPLTEKITVKGPDRHALYAFLTAGRSEPKWNFHKYLVGPAGDVIADFPSSVSPDSPDLRNAIIKSLSGS